MNPDGKHESLGRINSSSRILFFECVACGRQVHGPTWRSGGYFERPSKHDRNACSIARLPGDLRELAIDVLLIKTGTRSKEHLIAPYFVVAQRGCDDES